MSISECFAHTLEVNERNILRRAAPGKIVVMARKINIFGDEEVTGMRVLGGSRVMKP